MTLKLPETRGMVLAAGFGTRMRPLTEYMPKPLVPVCNVPMLENVLINLATAGVSQVAVNSHHLSNQLADFINESLFKDDVSLFHEAEILGTGGGIVNARDFLSQTEYFILHNSDILTDINLSELLDFHYSSGNKVTMTLTDGPENKVVVKDRKVYDILGKLGMAPEDAQALTYTGIMVMSKEIFDFLPPEVCNCSIITALLELMIKFPDSVGAYIPKNIYWNDLGTLPKYFQAHHDILIDECVKLPHYAKLPHHCFADVEQMPNEVVYYGFTSSGTGIQAGQGAYIENCIILNNSIIEPNSFHCNQVIHPEFIVHRDELELRKLKILQDMPTATICSLQEQGSSRGFYRIKNRNNDTRILMVTDAEDPDFKRFIDHGQFFGGKNKLIPQIYKAVTDEYTVLIEDLGNQTLCSFVKSGHNAIQVERMYQRVIDSLVDFQQSSLEKAPRLRVFNPEYLRWETAYFAKNLLGNYCGITQHELSLLDLEFDLLAELVFSHGQILMHRDFQSQNIMIDPCNQIRFVDYQGMRLGSPGYDIMSLVYDPYVELPHEIRMRLLQYYTAKTGVTNEVMIAAGMQRIMQALGAYGFLGLVKKKQHYLQYIPFAFSMLKELLQNPPLPMPTLTRLIDKISI